MYATLMLRQVLNSLLVLLLLLLAGGALTGCVSSKKVDALLAQTRVQAERQAITDAVLMKLAEKGSTVVGDTLANMEPGGAAGYGKYKRALRDANNQPLVDKDGKPYFEEFEIVGKSRSGREFANLKKGTITLAGLPRNGDGTVCILGTPDGMRVEIEGTGEGGSTVDEDWARVWGEAITSEKAAIMLGMLNLTTARGAAWAVRFNAAADGISRVVTSLGEVTGKILTATVIPTPADLAAQGVSKLVEAVIDTGTGKQTVLAADTATSRAATDCEGCVYRGE